MRLFLLTLLCLILPCTAISETKVLKVGVALGDPFVMVQNQNDYSGIAIDIWKDLADELKIPYQFVPMGEHIDEAVQALADGKVDVLVGPVVPTYDRMKHVDFMEPYYLNHIGLVVHAKHVNFFDALVSIFNSNIDVALLILFLFFIFYLHVFWYYEIRRQNPGISYWNGITNAFWMHTLDIDLGKIPTHTFTRQCRFVWVILLVLLFSSVTASITSSLTVALSNQYASENNVDYFKNKPIAAVIHTAPYDIARNNGFIDIVAVNSREEAMNLLVNKKVEAYIDYYPIADYYLNQRGLSKQLTLSNLVVEKDTFSFALPINSPLRYVLNLRLRENQSNGSVRTICEKYFMGNKKAMMDCEI